MINVREDGMEISPEYKLTIKPHGVGFGFDYEVRQPGEWGRNIAFGWTLTQHGARLRATRELRRYRRKQARANANAKAGRTERLT
jgi:hypothetical protein